MEVLFGKTLKRFVNGRLGSFRAGERISGHAETMRHLASLGLVTLDSESKKKPLSDGPEAQLSVSPAAEVLPTTIAEKPKKRKKKAQK